MSYYNAPLVFVHIPKTAGTSFRNALENKLGNVKVAMDYGLQYEGTSQCVKNYFKHGDAYEFYQQFTEKEYEVLSGHFNVGKYINLFSAQSTVTFLRDPVKRVISEYSHFKRHFDYQGSLEDFYTWDRNRNFQSRKIGNIPRQALGLVGLTERYDESLELVEDRFGIKLPFAKANIDPTGLAEKLSVTEEELSKIREENTLDVELYDSVVTEFELQLSMMRKGIPYTYTKFYIGKGGRLNGWAFQRGREKPIVLVFRLNNKLLKKVICQSYVGELHRFGLPRKGYLGFNLELPLLSDDILSCEVEDTDQLFDIDFMVRH